MEKNKAMPRTFLFHQTCPKGKIFTDRDDYDQAVKDGWVEAPQDIGQDPESIKKRKIMQNPMSRIEELEKENKELKAKIEELEEKISDLETEGSKATIDKKDKK
jgi:predicted RNase H-like nuclease (RuvC/YqgF family)